MKFTLIASLVAATQAVTIHQTDATDVPQMPVLGDHEMTPEEVEFFFVATAIVALSGGVFIPLAVLQSAQTEQADLSLEELAQLYQPMLDGEDLSPEDV